MRSMPEDRHSRARLLRSTRSEIAEQARAAGPDAVVLVIDPRGDRERSLASAMIGEPAALLAASTTIVTAVDRKRVAKATRARWPRLVERISQSAPDGEVWVLVIARGGATLASYASRIGTGLGLAVGLA